MRSCFAMADCYSSVTSFFFLPFFPVLYKVRPQGYCTNRRHGSGYEEQHLKCLKANGTVFHCLRVVVFSPVVSWNDKVTSVRRVD